MKYLSLYIGIVAIVNSVFAASDSSEKVALMPTVMNEGVGARALGLGNNFTAIANDYSAVYWNPAGLAFMPVREVHVGLDEQMFSGKTDFAGKTTDYEKNQMSLSSAGYVRSLPTTKGGFALAIGYSSPYSLTDLRKMTGADVYTNKTTGVGNENGSLFYGDSIFYDNYKYYNDGHLDLWTLAAGWQIAKGFGFGFSTSFLSGRENRHLTLITHTKSSPVFDYFPDNITKLTYTGYDIRIGGLYQTDYNLSIGARVEIPKIIHYETENTKGKLKSSFSGAIGASYMLPYVTFVTDVNFRSPNPDVDEGDLAYWKMGVGAGVEVPIKFTILRVGYKWQELDLYPYAEYQDGSLVNDHSVSTTTDNDMQMITAGLTFVISKSVTVDAAYAYNQYSTITSYTDYLNKVKEDYSTQKGMVTVSVRY